MTIEEAKKFLPIIQAYAEGKTIQINYPPTGWKDIYLPSFNGSPSSYRIKPEPKCRPFKDAEECWTEMEKHQPFGWVKDSDGSKFTIGTIASSDGCIFVSDEGAFYLGEMFEKFKFADGIPFGVKVEE